MEIQSAVLSATFGDCLFTTEEVKASAEWPPDGAILVEGVMNKYGFHSARLEKHRTQVTQWLEALPRMFRAEEGGGWSFLNACQQEDGTLWTGEHRMVEKLLCLGMGLNLVKCQTPRAVWSALPGGMPYYVISVGEPHETETL